MSGRNIVPMPRPAPQAAPQMPMPNPMMWSGGGMPAGCCPPGGMDALLQCYCDVQAATAFISKVVIDLATNDPAFQKALVDAIAASGSNIPLLGVTNGTPAQPGQVGEYVQILQVAPYPATQGHVQSVTMGILQPGDWLAWCSMGTNALTTGVYMELNPQPVGFTGTFANELAGVGMGAATALIGPPCQALISVPTLVVLQITTNLGGPGTASTAAIFFNALRVR